MESTSGSEVNLPTSKIFVVREQTENSNHEGIENRNKETGSSHSDFLQEQQENELREIKEINYWSGLYVFIILGSCVAGVSILTVIPVHNIFEFPEFWWENIFPRGLCWILALSLGGSWQLYLVFKTDVLEPRRYFLMFFMIFFLGTYIPYCGVYVVWTLYMGYNFPMPFGSVPCAYIGFISVYSAVWFGFPSQWRNQPEIKQRLKFFLFFVAVWLTVGYQDIFLDIIFRKAKSYQNKHGIQVQPIMAFLIPICRTRLPRLSWKLT
jgi:hypothetical protein